MWDAKATRLLSELCAICHEITPVKGHALNSRLSRSSDHRVALTVDGVDSIGSCSVRICNTQFSHELVTQPESTSELWNG
ncbi:hypothetical protein EVAR_86942_1 [Eumeta japonica]|uniref:Uncharacterized protein n=1 Tax=Eumeta variegata TaxID=151549 RepID=A0A4C1W723_EUMVA|nr:hypothetical protein EVAR_86942_1 [Eumeta japonica]